MRFLYYVFHINLILAKLLAQHPSLFRLYLHTIELRVQLQCACSTLSALNHLSTNGILPWGKAPFLYLIQISR
uniref:Putative secreted protein n=1 Tax=Anopheles darlingi TaxID=43151 RepID=A0A2M4DIF9_ANODA